jgi:excinuclease ABC subunit B
VLVGVNLLREGLDLPEVSLVAILDADKEGFLRSERSLIQTAGRAARHAQGRVILYGDKITQSMQKLIDTTEYRRKKQQAYNELHGIIPQTVQRERNSVFGDSSAKKREIKHEENMRKVAEEDIHYLTLEQLNLKIADTKKKMEAAAKDLDFLTAAQFRDEMLTYQAKAKEIKR